MASCLTSSRIYSTSFLKACNNQWCHMMLWLVHEIPKLQTVCCFHSVLHHVAFVHSSPSDHETCKKLLPSAGAWHLLPNHETRSWSKQNAAGLHPDTQSVAGIAAQTPMPCAKPLLGLLQVVTHVSEMLEAYVNGYAAVLAGTQKMLWCWSITEGS